ncbi:hypothetical protein G3580_14340 [Nitrogeniibacter mangrovi]|uniref:Uncharacterized protein n=1 Tax=Nitrogeniibacter mangrovi TaxID=2016596 RepID=A0A6C1B4R3_9RHOO|nr:hypothetical protein [Nitrogeniibacter mangrovi]QID18696.1 hypothetical protein G3580_14340 [Nitrogeniibacter mangrovi]
MWRRLRIALLLLVLATVALNAWRARARATEWKHTLHVTIYPINADGSATTTRYLDSLDADTFRPIETWIAEQAEHFGIRVLQPVRIVVAPPGTRRPPAPPRERSGVNVMLWSLQMRYWAWRHDDAPGPRPDVRLFALYHDPARTRTLTHSVGLEKGLIGIANLFATRHEHGSNLVVLGHEMLHTLGATDKYDPGTTLPRFPDGYAEPGRTPRYPQRLAEIMGGRIPLSATRAEIPGHLRYTVIGPATAGEIGWTR